MTQRLNDSLANAAAVYLEAFASAVEPPPQVRVSDWAAQHRVLSSMESSHAGLWQNSRTPFLVEIMDAMSPSDPTEECSVMKGTQMGVSEVGINVIGCYIDQHPAAIMMVRPTSLEAKRYNRVKLDPAFNSTECLRGKVKEVKTRDQSNSALLKQFRDGVLVLAGANSPTELSSMPVKYMIRDEMDRYPLSLGREGDPVEISGRRVTNFPRHKIMNISSPTEMDLSRIHEKYLEGDQRKYFVPCPHCGHKQFLHWNQVKFEQRKLLEYICKAKDCGTISQLETDSALRCPECHVEGDVNSCEEQQTDEVTAAWYECEACRQRIDEHHKPWMLALENGAEWVPQKPGSGKHKSWHLPALYSPLGWYSWREAAEMYLKAQRDPDKMREFTNFVLGEPYQAGDAVDHDVLKERIDDYHLGQVPAGALLLTASVDVQGDRLEYKCKGYGRGEESWLIDYQVLWGDTSQTDVWDRLDDLLVKRYPHAGGTEIGTSAVLVDSGYRTQEVYAFVRRAKHRRVLAIKGVEGAGRTVIGRPTDVDFNHKGVKVKRGVKVWPLGVDTIKETVQARLQIETPGPKYMHFPQGLSDDYFQQLTAERKQRARDRRGRSRTIWFLPKGKRNEASDLENYCYAGAVHVGMTAMTETRWAKLEKYYNPNQQDLFQTAISQQTDEAPASEKQTEQPAETQSTSAPVEQKNQTAPAATPRARSKPRRKRNWIRRTH